MAHRTFRLSISPEETPEARRVIELDGRSSLADLHQAIIAAFGIEAGRQVYAFFTSGRFWDAATAYIDPRAEGRRADKALLFRLGLSTGKRFAYLLGFDVERHFVVDVLAITDAARALASPVVVEAVGEAPPATPAPELPDAPVADQAPPELGDLVKLAEVFLAIEERLVPFQEEVENARQNVEPWADELVAGDLAGFEHRFTLAPDKLEQARLVYREAALAAQTLVSALDGHLQSFLELDDWLLAHSLGARLLDLPVSLALVGETEPALALARALVFVSPDLMQGDIAVILARAGRAEDALAQLEKNLDSALDPALVEAKAGDTYRALGDPLAAEAYYRRSLAVSRTSSDRLRALLRLVTCLLDTGRDAEASAALDAARIERGEPEVARAVVGRNEPCPCGSGKKYKKCHGAAT